MTASFLSGSAPTILVVDDDDVIRLLLRQFLESEGYTVEEAENGQKALDKLSRQSFDLIILDIAMPGIDGPDVCETITTSYDAPPPILMVTAHEDEESVERSFKAGAIDYIRKPIRWPVLKNRIRYILDSRRFQQELELLSRNYELILDTAANGICGIDQDQRISYINPIGLKMLRFQLDEVIGKPYRDIFKISLPGAEDFNVECCPFFTGSDSFASLHHDEVRLLRKDGTNFPVDFQSTPIVQGSKVAGGVVVFQDCSERQEAAEIVRYMANHDSLTNLPNRNYFRKRLPQAISFARRYDSVLCLLFVDLDRFKPINDTYGHGVGDGVLREVARRLTTMLRKSDSVCRLGGDEFVILLESTGSVEGATHVAEKTIELLNEPIDVDKHVCYIGASIGISVFPQDCNDAETMLRHADIAMYEAKRKGRNRWEIYAGSDR